MDLDKLLRHRHERDRFFAESYASPIPDEDLAGFSGLAYFPPDETLVVQGTLVRTPEIALSIEHTIGMPRTYRKVGEATVSLFHSTFTLTVLDGGDGDPFIPFRDTTAGTETYEGGRYLPVELGDGAEVILDFNLAQNPWCVYDPEFACPLPPSGNVLPFPIRAGEKMYRPGGPEARSGHNGTAT